MLEHFVLAQEASACEEDLSTSPLVHIQKMKMRRFAFPLLLHSQFKQAIGVAIAWVNATHQVYTI